jgi:tripartite-type tricarboxylate transporter receptor subunit TctC
LRGPSAALAGYPPFVHHGLHCNPEESFMNRSIRILARLAACVSCVWAIAAFGQGSYPSRPIRVIVPFAPGGGSDVLLRQLGPHLTERLKQPIVMDNRPASSGILGADIVAKAAPDGYTLLSVTPTFVIGGALRTTLPYDVRRDFAALTMLISTPFGLLVNPSFPAKSVKELIAYARANPGKVNYGTSGPGSSPHLTTELFSSMAGIRMTAVPYKGIALANTALLGGEVQLVFSNMFSTMGHWKAGRLRLIAHAGSKRREQIPDVPTIAESGVPGFEASNWYGCVVPAKTPRPVVQRLYREFAAVTQIPEVRQALVAQLNDVVVDAPEDFAKVLESEAVKWGGIGKKLGLKLD